MNNNVHAHTLRTLPGWRLARTLMVCACLLAVWPRSANTAPAMYGIDNANSWVRVLVYSGGLLSRLGHNHVISHRNIRGCLRMETPIYRSQLLAELAVNEFTVDEHAERIAAGGEFPDAVPDKDIAATRENMLGPALLDAKQHPQVRLTAAAVSGTFPHVQMAATLHIQDRQVPITVPLTLQLEANSVIASGSLALDHEQLGLRRFSAALGALRVRNLMEMQFHIASQRLGTAQEISDCQRALAVVDNDNAAVFDPATK